MSWHPGARRDQPVRVTPGEFATALSTRTRVGTDGLIRYLEAPTGRRPPENWVRWSGWRNGLSDEDRDVVTQLLHESAHSAVFGVCSVLDGVAAIEPAGPKGDLVLTYVSPSGLSVQLNDPDVALLHDEFNAREM